MVTRLRVNRKGFKRLAFGHLWVYQNEIENPKPELSGTIVGIENPDKEFVGQGFYNHHSKIAFRVLSRSPEAIGRDFFVNLIRSAIKRRAGKISRQSALRLVNAEGDLFPGLIADWYAGHLVIQCLIPGTERLFEMIADIFWEELKPDSIWFRNDGGGREMEGLPEDKYFWKGVDDPRVVIEEQGLKFAVNLMEGHKTGLYLDQAENRVRASEFARGRCLDAFSYQGGFALHLSKKAQEVIAVDSSVPALAVLEKNLELNDIRNVKVVRENIFDLLPEMEREKQGFDLIVMDPPPFARSKKDFKNARRGYYEVNRRALTLLNPGGILLSYSCSFHFSLSDLIDTLRSAMGDTGRRGRLLEIHTQAKDHPIFMNVPESWYLKGVVLEVD